MTRGDVILVRFPHPSGVRGKRRPAAIVQEDGYSAVVRTFVVAQITSNQSMAGDPACLFIDSSTSEGHATGLTGDSVVSLLALATIYAEAVDRTLGSFSPATMLQHESCLKVALALT